MSRSRRKTDIIGNGGESEKYDKTIANRRLRKLVKVKVKQNPEAILPIPKEISNNWDFCKDGKHYFGDRKSEDPEYYKKCKRK